MLQIFSALTIFSEIITVEDKDADLENNYLDEF